MSNTLELYGLMLMFQSGLFIRPKKEKGRDSTFWSHQNKKIMKFCSKEPLTLHLCGHQCAHCPDIKKKMIDGLHAMMNVRAPPNRVCYHI